MKLNISKLQEGGTLPNVTVTANKLKFVSPEEKARFDLIRKNQGDTTALNWLNVKQGTTAGINSFMEHPVTTSLRNGYEVIKRLSESKMPVIFSVPDFLSNQLKKANFTKLYSADRPLQLAMKLNLSKLNSSPDLSNYYNTPIPENMMDRYKDWCNKLPINLRETKDYDLQGAFLDNQVTHNNHLSDKFKKPNHPTFSNESIYKKYATPGEWKDNMFIIPDRNIDRLEEIRRYLKISDPGVYPVFNGGIVLPEIIINGK